MPIRKIVLVSDAVESIDTMSHVAISCAHPRYFPSFLRIGVVELGCSQCIPCRNRWLDVVASIDTKEMPAITTL